MLETLVCVALAKELVFSKIEQISHDYGVSESLMTFIVQHESNFNNCAVGDSDLEKPSLGLVQISMLYNPSVSPKMAYDTDFSLEFLASRIREGRASMWSTYKLWLSRTIS